MMKNEPDRIYKKPPCGFVDDEGYRVLTVCGLTEMKPQCVRCGLNRKENERRKQLPLEPDPKTGLKRKIIRR